MSRVDQGMCLLASPRPHRLEIGYCLRCREPICACQLDEYGQCAACPQGVEAALLAGIIRLPPLTPRSNHEPPPRAKPVRHGLRNYGTRRQ